MFKKLQDWFIDYLTKNLLKSIRKRDIFQVEKKMMPSGKIVKQLIYRGKVVNPEFQLKMKEGAMNVKGSTVWRMISAKARWTIYERLYFDSKNVEDMRAGKMALYTLKLIEDLFDELMGL